MPGRPAHRPLDPAERIRNTRKARRKAEQIVAEDDGNVVADAVLAEEALRRTDLLTP
jgi:hypothetical protein